MIIMIIIIMIIVSSSSIIIIIISSSSTSNKQHYHFHYHYCYRCFSNASHSTTFTNENCVGAESQIVIAINASYYNYNTITLLLGKFYYNYYDNNYHITTML